MGVLGEGGITLTAVSDACSVVLSPSSCVIHADFDGSNPILTHAYTNINVVRGDVKLAIGTGNVQVTARSDNNITYQITAIDSYTVRLSITAIPTTILNGSISFTVSLDAFQILSSFPFSVARESSMLDWIQDWNTRRTSINGDSIITPKIFAGVKDANNLLTGVYIGPDTLGAGIYGYKAEDGQSKEVFHINSNGASIGGWSIETGGISSVDETTGYSLQLLSSGSIISKDNSDNVIYALYRDGEARFANGNVLFHADGSALFTGKIEASDGNIGGWVIAKNAIHQSHVIIDSLASSILVLASDNYESAANSYESALSKNGGIKMHYTNVLDYGLEGWLPELSELKQDEETGEEVTIKTHRRTFSIGSVNQIGSWYFDHERLYSNHVVLAGREGSVGVYVAAHNISEVSVSGLSGNIANATGIYLTAADNYVELAEYGDGNLVFKLSTTGNQIAGWKFDNDHLWTVSDNTDADGFTTNDGAIIIGPGVLVGPKWRFNQDGSGKLAGGKLDWDASGSLTLTGGILKSGDSDTPAWIFKPDGSGKLAGGNISWTSSSLSLTGTLQVSGGCVQLDNAGICSEGNDNSSIRFWAGCSHSNRNNEVGGTNGPKFTVTQGGTLYASDAHITGEITANSGKIGPFDIGTWLTSTGTNYKMGFSAARFYIQSSDISVLSDRYDDSSSAIVSFDTTQSSYVNISSYESAYYSGSRRINIASSSVITNPNKYNVLIKNVALELKASGAAPYTFNRSVSENGVDGAGRKGNFAIMALAGKFAGLRPEVVAVGGGNTVTLNSLEFNIIIAGDCTIQFPANPEDGQMYLLFILAKYNVTLNFNGKKCWRTRVGYNTTQGHSSLEAGLDVIIYSALRDEWEMVSLSSNS